MHDWKIWIIGDGDGSGLTRFMWIVHGLTRCMFGKHFYIWILVKHDVSSKDPYIWEIFHVWISLHGIYSFKFWKLFNKIYYVKLL